MTDYSYIGVGKLSIRVQGSSAPLAFVGNCSSLGFTIEEETKELKDFTQGGGGTYNEVRRVSGVTCAMSLHDLSPENVARAIFGESSAIAAAAVTTEAHTGYKGGFVPSDNLIDETVAPVITAGGSAATRANVTAYAEGVLLKPATPNDFYYKVTTAGTSAASPPVFGIVVGGTTTDGTAVLTCMGKTTLVVDTDYTVSGGGIYIDSAAAFTDGQSLNLAYTKVASNVVEALLNSSQEYEMVFDGLNEARSGKATVVHAYRVKFGAAKDISLIGEDYAVMEQEGKVLKDTTKNGTSLSQYFKVKIAA